MRLKKWYALPLSAMLLTIICELLPYGAVLRFPDEPSGAVYRQLFSYFDPTPYGYANFGPFLTALLSVVLAVLLAVLLFVPKPLAKLSAAVRVLNGLTLVTSLMPLMLTWRYYSVLGGIITLLLLAAFVTEWIAAKKERAL